MNSIGKAALETAATRLGLNEDDYAMLSRVGRSRKNDAPTPLNWRGFQGLSADKLLRYHLVTGHKRGHMFMITKAGEAILEAIAILARPSQIPGGQLLHFPGRECYQRAARTEKPAQACRVIPFPRR